MRSEVSATGGGSVVSGPCRAGVVSSVVVGVVGAEAAQEEARALQKRFNDAAEGTLKHIEKDRGTKEYFMVAMMLVIGGFASYQSLSFGSQFARRMLGPGEAGWIDPSVTSANATALNAFAEGFSDTSGASAYGANVLIPVICADVAFKAMLNMLGCFLTGVGMLLGGCCNRSFVQMSQRNEWYNKTAFVYSCAVLGLAAVGSIANVKAAYDSVKHEADWLKGTVTVTNAIVQALLNTRSVRLLLSQDMSHLKKTRLQMQNDLLPAEERLSKAELHAKSTGLKKPIHMSTQALLFAVGLMFSAAYTYTASVKILAKDNPDMDPVLRGILGWTNFAIKTTLLTRAVTHQGKRLINADKSCGKRAVGFALLAVFGVLSVSGAAEYPKRYFFNDQVGLSSSLWSVLIAEGSCFALNFGDMHDAVDIIYGMASKFKRLLTGEHVAPAKRYGATYPEMVKKSITKTRSQDEGDIFHHRGYQPGHFDADSDVAHIEVTAKPRGLLTTAAGFQPGLQTERVSGHGGYEPLVDHASVEVGLSAKAPSLQVGGVELSGVMQYHIKSAGRGAIDSWRRLKELRGELYQAERKKALQEIPHMQNDRLQRAADRATAYADKKMNRLYQHMLTEKQSREIPAGVATPPTTLARISAGA